MGFRRVRCIPEKDNTNFAYGPCDGLSYGKTTEGTDMRIIKLGNDHAEDRIVCEVNMLSGGKVRLSDSIYAGANVTIESGSYSSTIPQEWFSIQGSYDEEEDSLCYNGITNASMAVAIPGLGDTLIEVRITLEDYFELLDVEQLQDYISHKPKKDS